MGYLQNLSLLLLLLAGQTLADEYGEPYPDWWRRREVPRLSTTQPRFNAEQFERWAAAQPPEAKPFIDFIRTNLNHITQKEFETELGNAFQKFLSLKGDTRPLMFVTLYKPGEPVKSGAWATALIREKFPEATRDASFFNLGMDMNSSKRLDEFKRVVAEGNFRVVVVEDGMYSGNQLAEALFPLTSRMKELDVVVPFATNRSYERLNGNKGFGIPVQFHRSKEMPTVMELLERLPAAERQAIERLVDVRDTFSDSNTLTFFDHKLPDFFSFPRWIAEGWLLTNLIRGQLRPLTNLNRITLRLPGPTPAFPFLTDGNEPYKCRSTHIAGS